MSDPRALVVPGAVSARAAFRRVVGNDPEVAPARRFPSTGLRTDGIAFHPYQHDRTPGGTPDREHQQDWGIGRLSAINSFVSDAYRRRARNGQRLLRVASNNARPQLFATEFGYFNRRLTVNGKLTPANTAKLESERATYWPLVLERARNQAHVRSFLLYQPAEADPPQVGSATIGANGCEADGYPVDPRLEYKNNPFDTGFINEDTGEVRGDRDYGFHFGMRDPCFNFAQENASAPARDVQARAAYCAIHSWTRVTRTGYPWRQVLECG